MSYKPWTLHDALDVLRLDLWPKLESVRWYCALTGSILLTGESKKDLDVIVYPGDTEKSSRLDAEVALHAARLNKVLTFEEIKKLRFQHTDARRRDSTDQKEVEMWEWRYGVIRKRVDIIWWPSKP